jgi:tripartite-type tricarboxylate transporter receptor subunit TctC
VKNATPDGYTILLAASATVTDLVTTRNPTFDVRTDLEPITKAVFGIQGIYVNADLPANTIPEFVAYAKANPGKLNYGTTGNGSVNHVSTEALSITTGIQMVHVPYAQGTGAFLAALMAGDIQFATTDVTGAQAAVDTGKVRILGVLATERMPSRPNTPAIVEFYPDMAAYTGTLWFGFFAPPKTPADILQRLHADITGCLNDPSLRTSLKKYGYEDNQIIANTPEQFKASIAADVGRLRDIVERAKIPLR